MGESAGEGECGVVVGEGGVARRIRSVVLLLVMALFVVGGRGIVGSMALRRRR